MQHREPLLQPNPTTSTQGAPRRDDPQLAEVVRRLVPALTPDQIILFGSAARGDAHPDSDYDICVLVPDSVSVGIAGYRAASRALRGTGIRAHIVLGRSRYLNQHPNELAAALSRDGVTLYDAPTA